MKPAAIRPLQAGRPIRNDNRFGYGTRFFERLAPALETRLAERPPVLFPNIGKILAEVSNGWKATALRHGASRSADSNVSGDWNKNMCPDAVGWKLGLVTGNIEATAWMKLRYAGIDQYFSFGGFGCTHADRSEIVISGHFLPHVHFSRVLNEFEERVFLQRGRFR